MKHSETIIEVMSSRVCMQVIVVTIVDGNCNSAVLVTMIYGVVVKDVYYSMSMGGRYALRRPCQATLGPIRTERAGVEIPA